MLTTLKEGIFFLISKKVFIILPWSNCILERLEHFFFGHPKKKIGKRPFGLEPFHAIFNFKYWFLKTKLCLVFKVV